MARVMDLHAVYDKNSDEISTNIFRSTVKSSHPKVVIATTSSSRDDEITWFQRLSPDQKSTSRFSLPDWLRRGSKDQKKALTASGTQERRHTDSSNIRHTSSVPNLSASHTSKPTGNSSSTVKRASTGISAILAPLAEISQASLQWSHVTREVTREVSSASSTSYQHNPQHFSQEVSQPAEDTFQQKEDPETSSYESGISRRPARSLTTVLRHLSTVVDRSGQDYRDSDFKQYWMPDSQCNECYECGEKFTTLRRRHHCRVCGQIFCSRCCNQEVPGKFMGYTGNLRVCMYCCKIVLSYAQSSTGDLKLLQEDLTLSASEAPTTPDVTPRKKTDDSPWVLPRTLCNGSTDSVFNPFESLQTPKASSLEGSYQNVEQERLHLLKDSAQLCQLWRLIQHPHNGIMFQNHRFRLRTYSDCIVGSELVDWLLLRDKANDRLQAVAIGQALVDAKWLESVTSHEHGFHDEYALYRAGKTAVSFVSTKDVDLTLTDMGELDTLEDNMEPSWLREIDQGYKESMVDDDSFPQVNTTLQSDKSEFIYRHRRVASDGEPINRSLRPTTDLFTGALSSNERVSHDTAHRERDSGLWEQEGPLPGMGEVFPNGALSSFQLDQCSQTHGSTLAQAWCDMDIDEQGNGEGQTLETLLSLSSSHLVRLAEQQLKVEGLDMSWLDTILQLAKGICASVRPDVMNGDDIDIRHYVHIKKVPGGNRADCFKVNGTICTKNIAHRKMAGQLSNPKIILLQSAIDHQRVENKFSSLTPIVLQEHEYLKNCIARIAALKPDILIVEKTVARLAQTFLLHSGISLVLNMKPSVMERLSRSTEVSLVPSIDQVNQTTGMGSCLMFRLHKYDLPQGYTKTLMFFEGCPSHLGCSVIVRGGDYEQLTKVKRVLQLMVYANYHSRLEISFLMDEFAELPQQSMDADKTTASQESSSPPTSSTTGAPGSAGQGLASIQDAMNEPADQVDIVSELGQEQELMMRDEMDAAVGNNNVGSRAVSSMKRWKDKMVASVKNTMQQPTESEQSGGHNRQEKPPKEVTTALPGDHNDAADVTSQSVDQQSADAPRMTEEDNIVRVVQNDEQNPEEGDTAQTANADNGRPTDLRLDVQASKEGVVKKPSICSQPSFVPDFDHEAATIELESAFVEESLKSKLAAADSLSISSQDELAVVVSSTSTPPPSKKTSTFGTALEKVLLSTSPGVKFSVPFMETKVGRESPLVRFFPAEELFWSPRLNRGPGTEGEFSDDATREDVASKPEPNYGNVDRCSQSSEAVIVKLPHPFIFSQLTEIPKDDATRTVLADFRARGGCIVQKPRQSDGQEEEEEEEKQTSANVSRGKYSKACRQGVDCLDIYNHQRLMLQFCSYSHLSSNTPNHCVNPWIVTMEFYSRNDLTLGEFLERYCFSSKYKCPSEMCDAVMADHVRRFVHGNASIHVLLRHLESPIPGFTDKILMWSWCRKCKQVTPVQPMSLDTWQMSFGKYLELRFHCKSYNRRMCALPCAHSLHRQHYQYFGQHNIVASFKYSPIQLREIFLPPLPLHIKQPFRSHLVDEFNNVSAKGSQLLSDVQNKIFALTGNKDMITVQAVQYLEQRNTQFKNLHKLDSTKFWQDAKELQTKITNLAEQINASKQKVGEIITNLQLDIEDSTVNLKRHICEIAVNWNNRFTEFVQQEKERNKKKSTVLRPNTQVVEKDNAVVAIVVKDPEQGIPVPSRSPGSRRFFPPEEPVHQQASTTPPEQPATMTSLPVPILHLAGRELTTPSPTWSTTTQPDTGSEVEDSVRFRGDSDVHHVPPSKAYLDQFSHKKMPDYGISPGLYAGLHYQPPLIEESSTPPEASPVIVELPAPEEYSQPKAGEDLSAQESATPPHQANEEIAEKRDVRERENAPEATPQDHETEATPDTTKLLKTESPNKKYSTNNTMKAFFSTLLPGSDVARVDMPYPPDEHYVLPPYTIIPVIIYDQEPSSIIAFALSSQQYKTQLYELQQPDPGKPNEGTSLTGSVTNLGGSTPTMRPAQTSENNQGYTDGKERPKKGQLPSKSTRVMSYIRSKIPDSPSSSSNTQPSFSDPVQYMPSNDDLSSVCTEAKDETDFDFFTKNGTDKKDVFSPHIELQFSDATNTQFFCLVYHAEQFLQLRKLMFPAGEEMYIRSLSRSVSWLAQGGKSRSKFLKTKDDRFILKQISRLEFQSFKEFAPHYFKYMKQAHTEQRPTALAKILGVYKLGYHNPVTNTAQKHVLLVLENLFYQRRMAQVFDLKGSIRNRHVKTTGVEQQDLVLMDENLLKHIVDSPLYIRNHSKAVLAMAVYSDTMFLASHFIMDYSLLVGLDATSDELVVGIIDYIRTFTWDKKLEMMVKSTGIVGGQGKLPTVVSPELYRTRFCEAMDKYFLLVPDRWHNLRKEF